MSWAVEIVVEGGQKDGRVAYHYLVDDFVELGAILANDVSGHVFEVHAYQAGDGQEVAKAMVEKKRAGR